MARGWESKSVEDQIADAQARDEARHGKALTPAETEQVRRREALMLERTRLIGEMKRAYKRRHLEALERGLAYIEAELAKLNANPS